MGTYIHGIFDSKHWLQRFLKLVTHRDWEVEDYKQAKDRQLNQLAQLLEQSKLLEQ